MGLINLVRMEHQNECTGHGDLRRAPMGPLPLWDMVEMTSLLRFGNRPPLKCGSPAQGGNRLGLLCHQAVFVGSVAFLVDKSVCQKCSLDVPQPHHHHSSWGFWIARPQ